MKTIKSKKEFEKVFSAGKRYNYPLVSITVLKGDEGDCARVAFVAPKRLGNAVFRNRCKRVMREAARSCGLPAASSDVIMFATKKTHESSPAEIASALGVLLRRAGVSCEC